MATQAKIVSQYARMWPREAFNVMDGKKLLVNKIVDELKSHCCPAIAF